MLNTCVICKHIVYNYKICIVTLEVSSLLSEEDTSKKVIEGVSTGMQMIKIPGEII